MSERLTDDELDALIQRFRPERHPKVAVALEELGYLRAESRHRVRQSAVPGTVVVSRSFTLFSCECGWSVELPVGTKSHTCETCGRSQEVVE